MEPPHQCPHTCHHVIPQTYPPRVTAQIDNTSELLSLCLFLSLCRSFVVLRSTAKCGTHWSRSCSLLRTYVAYAKNRPCPPCRLGLAQ
ncbi:hypothetical protein F2P81_006011 [Scophthalmus maximus]|uniref:Uncharacterized protein n=1 Tax=Scophthalmus maximus TaxID=52904 RepID=A0A6A4TC87_SCOMX|nr:hypothetical protein F2P81_006011 [Scophthalmus maximus]